MKFAVSNLALPSGDLSEHLPQVAALGAAGVEIVPLRLWPQGLPAASDFGRQLTSAGLELVGFHDLLLGRRDLSLFGDADTLSRTVEYLVQLSALCRDLGGKTLCFGASGRKRGDLTPEQAWLAVQPVLEQLLPRIEDHGTLLCIEPTGAADADFCVTARECRLLVDYFDHPALGFQLSARAQVENGDTGHAPFSALRGRLNLFHANEPDHQDFSASGISDHPDCRRHLASIGFQGWVTLVQRMGMDAWGTLEDSYKNFLDVYLRQDNASLARHDAQYQGDNTRHQAVEKALEAIRPMLQNDGGDMELVGISGDQVRVRLKGACTGCSMAAQTLGGIRRQLVDQLGVPLRVVPVP